MYRTSILLAAAILVFLSSSVTGAEPMANAFQPAGEGILAPSGFEISLVASEPMVANPAAMCVAPDGRIFVCEEYVHAEITGKKKDVVKVLVGAEKGGPATQAILLAEDLNSVQGLAFHDGKLYIAQSPFISVLPVSAANEPGTLTHLVTGIGAGPKGFSPSHQASGLIVRDGKLYMCHGDQGCDVQTREGGRIRLDTGGILRCNLDGSNLEVFASGFRNIYDLAIDPEGNAFSRENDNDGFGYNCRSYHIVKRGYYGWPFRYRDGDSETPPPDVLTLSRDQGHGSSTGCLYAVNPKFPAPFNDGLFFGDWTKAKILFCKPERKGATFDLPEETFIADQNVPKSKYQFRPTSVCLAPDGSILVADMATLWLHSRAPVGRVLRVRYTGTAAAAVPVSPATSLSSQTAADVLMAKLASSDARERARAAQLIGDTRYAGGAAAVAKLLGDADAFVRLNAAIALGDLKDASSVPLLARAYETEKERWVRYGIVSSLRAIGDLQRILAAIERAGTSSVKVDLLYALRGVFEEKVAAALIELSNDAKTPELKAKATEFLGVVAKKGYHIRGGKPAPDEPRLIESWAATESILAQLRKQIRNTDPQIRVNALSALQKLNDLSVVDSVLSDLRAGRSKMDDDTALILLRSAGSEKADDVLSNYLIVPTGAEAVRIEAARRLSLGKLPVSIGALNEVAFDSRNGPTLVVAAVDGLGRRKDSASMEKIIALLKNGPLEVQRSAARAIGLIGGGAKDIPPTAIDALKAAADNPDRFLKTQALIALWRMGDTASMEALLPRLLAITSSDDEMQSEIIVAGSNGPREKVEPVILMLLENNGLGKNATQAALQPVREWAKSDFGYMGAPVTRPASIQKIVEYREKNYPQWKRPAAAARVAQEDAEVRWVRLTAAADAAKTDAAQGAAIFQKAGCLSCHQVGDKGARVGPNLTEIGSKYRRPALVESVLYPSKQILDGYNLVTLVLKEGGVISGIIQREDANTLQIVETSGAQQTVSIQDIKRRAKSQLSAMPQGLVNSLSDQEFFDLIGYLESLKKAER